MSNPVKTYLGLYTHVARLTAKAVGRAPMYLLAGPVLYLAVSLITPLFAPMGYAGGFLYAIVRAVAVGAALFVVRAIIEQRRLRTDDLSHGLTTFLGDVMTVFFTLFVAGLVLGQMLGSTFLLLYFFVLFGLPLFETIALTRASGFLVFGEAWRFFQRDAAAWLVGQIPLVIVLASARLLDRLIRLLVPLLAGLPQPLLGLTDLVLLSLPWALVVLAFVYRGILFLTLESSSPFARATKFGGADGYR